MCSDSAEWNARANIPGNCTLVDVRGARGVFHRETRGVKDRNLFSVGAARFALASENRRGKTPMPEILTKRLHSDVFRLSA